MTAEVQVTMRGLQQSEALEERIRERVAKLDAMYPGLITRCHVVAEQPHHHQHQGAPFVVRMDIAVPGKDIAVNRDHREDIYVALREACNAARRQLDQHARTKARKMHGRRTSRERASG
jgi:ribosome-associated translation inhibitor RaiA